MSHETQTGQQIRSHRKIPDGETAVARLSVGDQHRLDAGDATPTHVTIRTSTEGTAELS